ncbi:alpha/beta fold hydrolase [Nostocoides sp. F2B08]|uniref:alpha/beta fold hydrolase n=1 Tax=Nostocoides sp. F2B08 TaxID=2653936 RepID=UPI00351A26AA
MVLLHGAGATSSTWEVVAKAIAADRTVLAVDLRGHGASDHANHYSISTMADDISALLPKIADAPVDLVGHSLGGLVALRVAARHPGLLRRLVLEDVGMPHPRVPNPPSQPPGDLPFDWKVVEHVRPEVDNPAADWLSVVRAIQAPTLVVAGRDSFVDAAHVHELVTTLPDGRTVTLDTGHEVHAERPDEFIAALRAFLSP